MTDSSENLYLTADISAAVSSDVVMTANKETLYIHEVDRSGNLVQCKIVNYANFDVSATVFANGISYKTGGTDESGNTFEFDGSGVATAATLYDVNFQDGSFNSSTSAFLSDLISVNATNVNIKDLEFSGANITDKSKKEFSNTSLDPSHGTITFGFKYDLSGNGTDTTISKQIIYSIDTANGTLKVTKDDNVLASDKVGFGTDNSSAPTQGANDILTADLSIGTSLFSNKVVDFSGSIDSVSITPEVLTSAINNLIDASGNLADAQDDIDSVRAALVEKIANGSFLGLTNTANKTISIPLRLKVGSQAVTTKTQTGITPQIFFGKFTKAELNTGNPTTGLSN